MKKLILLLLIINILSPIYSAPVSEQIIIDQIGYRTDADKFFMIADPRTGQNSAITYVPGATVQLRRSSDNQVMQIITLNVFNNGNEYMPAGDVVWQGNFSSFTTPGIYHIYDPTNDRQSYNFEIGNNIYNTILRQAVKSYYYQRCGTAITSNYGGTWTHAACHTQQQNALLYDGGVVQGTQRNVSGGWHDAGDYRKYVTFTFTTLWDLLHAYEWFSDRFSDDTGIPESGNGIPDILDEIKYELDWLLRMQKTDGSLYSGVFVTSGGSGGQGDPSTETTTYYYANYSTAATVTGAMAFALGARIFAPFNASYSLTLRTAAENAWAFLETHTSNIQYNHSGFQNANANWADNHEKQGRVTAAAELFHLTGQSKYRDYVDTNYNSSATRESWGHQPILSGYFETGGSAIIQRGLVSYCLAPGATTAVVNAIKNSLNQGIQNQTYGQRNSDAYKAYMWDGHYTWGSNQLKAEWANLALWGVKLNVNPSLSSAYQKVAEEYLHYFHGRNPLSWCYLTQSNSAGADKQITQIYHGWFWDGTSWDTNPAPGFLAGGPNANYVQDTQNSGGTPVYPPGGEPRQKSYRDWNTNWPDCSWSVTEPGIYYQARYVFLCAAFAGAVATPTNTPTSTFTITPGGPTLTFTPTFTTTMTNTPTATATTPPPFLLIYDGDTTGYKLSDGTVYNGGTGTITEIAGGKTGNGMRLYYTNPAWWQEHRWDKTVNVNIGTNTHLVFDVKAESGSVNQFLVRINWSDNYPNVANYLIEGGGIDTNWKTAKVPLSVLLEAGQTQIDFITFINNWNADYTVIVDNIRLEGGDPTPTNTSTFTFTNTVTRTNTSTRTNTATMTNTYTLTNTQTNTATYTPSSTSTMTNTTLFTNTPTNTPTNTSTLTSTSTLTRTSTSTPTVTSTVQKVIVGAIRWDAWTGPQNYIGTQVEKTLSPSQYHYRIPFYGIEYSSNSVNIQCTTQECIDQEISYAASMCLDYWAFIWYPASSGLQQALNLYLSSSYKSLVNFCLIVEHNNYVSQISNAQIVNYMQMSEYQKVMGNRPLIYFFDGSDPNLNASNIASLRSLAVGAGLGNPYIVLLRISGDLTRINALGMDAWSMYAVSWVGNGAPYSALASTDVSQWNWVGVSNGYKFIPHVTSGWDKRPRHDNPVSWEPDPGPDAWVQMPTPLELANHVHEAVNWVNNNPSSAESRAVLIYAWNEFDEGGYICPNLSAYGGTQRLDALKNILCPAGTMTNTNTPTKTPTNSITPTYTNTFSSTSTQSHTNTATNTITFTPTNTLTPTETVTGSQPPTWTNTNTDTFTSTSTMTLTITPTQTQTSTFTSTQTPTYIFTTTPSFTSISTLTNTNTFTQTMTNTQQPTFSFTPTSTNSNTQVFTNTPTLTMTFTFTATLPVNTNTPTPQTTATQAVSEEFKFDEKYTIVNYPNPVIGNNDINIKYKLTQPENQVIIRLYTNAFRLVKEIGYSKSKITIDTYGIREITLKSNDIYNLSKGAYYYILIAKDTSGKETKSKIKKFLIIK